MGFKLLKGPHHVLGRIGSTWLEGGPLMLAAVASYASPGQSGSVDESLKDERETSLKQPAGDHGWG